MTIKDLDQILYFESYVLTDLGTVIKDIDDGKNKNALEMVCKNTEKYFIFNEDGEVSELKPEDVTIDFLKERDTTPVISISDKDTSFTANLALNNLNSTFVTNDTSVLHSLVFSAIAFPVFNGPKDLGTKKSVPLWLERTVIDRFRFFHFSMGPGADLLRRRQHDLDFRKRENVSIRRLKDIPPFKISGPGSFASEGGRKSFFSLGML